MVVFTSECPSSSCMVRMPSPDSGKYVVNACRVIEIGAPRCVFPKAVACAMSPCAAIPAEKPRVQALID